MKNLTQEVFREQPDNVDWVGVDYDGLMQFGEATNPRYTWASERWRGFELIGEPIKNSEYKPLTSLKREEILCYTCMDEGFIQLSDGGNNCPDCYPDPPSKMV